MTDLSELRSQGQQYYAINWSPPNSLQTGDSGEKVRLLQYMLSILSDFISGIPPLAVDGIFGSGTRAAVQAAQRRFGLPETGIVDPTTWDLIYDQYAGIENTALRSGETFPGIPAQAIPAMARTRNGAARQVYARSTTLTQFPGRNLSMGAQDPVRQEVVR